MEETVAGGPLRPLPNLRLFNFHLLILNIDERLHINTLMIQSGIHFLYTILGTEDTVVKRDREILNLMEFTF